ncbi:uncharacterized protein [Linepithema humile]|uniref:uncharacterized protein isoform X4 n=1 Tax=Linepithema humile TaxID=83485 RepID=UPI00351EB82F
MSCVIPSPSLSRERIIAISNSTLPCGLLPISLTLELLNLKGRTAPNLFSLLSIPSSVITGHRSGPSSILGLHWS